MLGRMGFQMDAFDYIFGIMMGEQKSIGNSVTSKAGYKLIPTYAVQEGDISFNPEEWRLISPNRFNDAEFAVIELSNDENIITSKSIITGDVTQIDLPSNEISGLIDATIVLNKISGISFVELTENDVVRHKLVKDIIKAYTKKGKNK